MTKDEFELGWKTCKEWMEAAHYSRITLRSRENQLVQFFAWARERGLSRPIEVTYAHLERYQKHLYRRSSEHSGAKLSIRTQVNHLNTLKFYFRYLKKHRLVVHNPAIDLDLPRIPRVLPKHVLSGEEIERIMSTCHLDKPYGVRDRAILEVLYSTAMRRGEISSLKRYDIDFQSGIIVVRLGKGRKDRMVPIGKRALHWLKIYLDTARPILLAGNPDPRTIFITTDGERTLNADAVGCVVKAALKKADLAQSGCCHLFRHAMATHMLESGIDLRFVQQMLGHASIMTTEIYTHVSIKRLKELHSRLHPTSEEPEA